MGELRTSDFDYELPEELIAREPAPRRDASRMLVVDRRTGALAHRTVADLVDYIPAGDALVVNETRVIPARLRGRKPTGARAEVLLLHAEDPDARRWVALVRPAAKLREGAWVEVAPELAIEVLERRPEGQRLVALHTPLPPLEALERFGEVPLPPYIGRPARPEDRERYQTVYARVPGSVAAPTAGLHFTPELLAALAAKGVRRVPVVLHVGLGTFRPVTVEDPSAHRMHSEWYCVPSESAAILDEVRRAGGRLWAVGTTVVRTLETAADAEGRIQPGTGWTDLFIRPPYRFRAVDHLLTNFHLPRSTLLMLVAAFAGLELTKRAYAEAVAHRYRFYSYGDAMLLL